MPDSNKPDANKLGELESAVMQVVWQQERASVQDVLDHLIWEKELAYTTVMTVLTRLTEKGFLGREKEGRTYIYFPRVRRQEIADSALKSVVNRFFDGISSSAVANLLSDREALDDDELAELEDLIRQAREARE